MKSYIEALTAFIALLQAQHDKEWPDPINAVTFRTDGNGQNFQRIVFDRAGNGGSAVAFVAIRDGKTKLLGEYKQGDIFMPAGYASPAKNVRGSIFENDGEGATNGRAGIRYLK